MGLAAFLENPSNTGIRPSKVHMSFLTSRFHFRQLMNADV